jgi:hypothetical protein
MINLSLPLSATALRLGSAFLSDLAAQSEVIRAEVRGPSTVGSLTYDVSINTEQLQQQLAEGGDVAQALVAATTLEQDVETAEAAVITQADLNPVQYETVVTGHERNPDYAGANAAFEQAALEAAGWTAELLLADGYLREVTEQRPLAVAPGASGPAPAPAPVPPAPAGSTVELDADGLPWDSRIHSDATVRKAATGKWKTRKNLPDGYKAQIEAELRAVMGAPTATTASVSAPAPVPVAPSAPVAAPPAPAAAAAPAAPSAAGNGAMTFADFTRYLVSNKVDQGKVMVQVQKVGLTSIPDLAKRPDLIPAVVEGLKG